MNDPQEKKDGGRNPGSELTASVASSAPKEPPRMPPAGNVATPPLPPVAIGKPGYQFKHAVNTPQGQEERREHERLRKADKRAAKDRSAEPLPLSPAPVVDTLQAPNGQQIPGDAATAGQVVAEPFIPWIAADVSDFTDELVELTEAKRVAQFVAIASEAKLPAKLIAQIESDAHYPKHSKSALKRCLADCTAKWLNKTGVSSKNKEEVKLIFSMFTIKLQGWRLKRDLAAMIAEDKAKRAETSPAVKAKAQELGETVLSIVK